MVATNNQNNGQKKKRPKRRHYGIVGNFKMPQKIKKTKKGLIRFQTEDCPGVDGKIPDEGSVKYTMTFHLPEGVALCVQYGQKTFDEIKAAINEDGTDDLDSGPNQPEPEPGPSLILHP